jgi:hypothetical protein
VSTGRRGVALAFAVFSLGLSVATAWARTRPRTGFLSIDTDPFTRVWVDGEDTGRTTPVRRLPLSPGHHRVTVLNLELKLCESFPVDVKAGRTVTIERTLERRREPERSPALALAGGTNSDATADEVAKPAPPVKNAPAMAEAPRRASGTLVGKLRVQGVAEVGAPDAGTFANAGVSLEGGGLGLRYFGDLAVGAEGWYRYTRTSPQNKDPLSLGTQRLEVRADVGYFVSPRCLLAARLGYLALMTNDFSTSAMTPNQTSSGPAIGLQLFAPQLTPRLGLIANADAIVLANDTDSSSATAYSLAAIITYQLFGPARALFSYGLLYRPGGGPAGGDLAQHIIGLGLELQLGG